MSRLQAAATGTATATAAWATKCALVLLSGCAHTMNAHPPRGRAAARVQGAKMEPQRFTLDNGLRVVIEENHAAKVVALEAWVDVGSASEPPEAAGVAHVFEHMLFKGTE